MSPSSKIYTFPNLLLTLKHYQSMLKYLSRDLKANVNILVLLNLIVPGNWRCHAQVVDKSSFSMYRRVSTCQTENHREILSWIL